MKYAEAFKSLGYDLQVPRQDWTAENEKGVCISIWRKETAMHDGLPFFDSNEYSGPLEDWIDKPGNSKRIVHLARALKEFSGVVDVVLVDGTPGEGYGDAHPWEASKRGAHWRITKFDPLTGHYRAEVQRNNSNVEKRS